MNIDDRGDRAEHVLSRVFVVIDERFRQVALVAARAGDGDPRSVLHLVEPIDAGFDRNPRQQMRQPPGGDRRHLRRGLGGVRQLTCGDVAERQLGRGVGHRFLLSRLGASVV